VLVVTSVVALVSGIVRGLGGIALVIMVASVVVMTVVCVDAGVDSVGTTLCDVETTATGCLALI